MMSSPIVAENSMGLEISDISTPAHPRQSRAREKPPVTPQAVRVPVNGHDPPQRLKIVSQRGASLRSPIGPQPLRGVRWATAAGEKQGGKPP